MTIIDPHFVTDFKEFPGEGLNHHTQFENILWVEVPTYAPVPPSTSVFAGGEQIALALFIGLLALRKLRK